MAQGLAFVRSPSLGIEATSMELEPTISTPNQLPNSRSSLSREDGTARRRLGLTGARQMFKAAGAFRRKGTSSGRLGPSRARSQSMRALLAAAEPQEETDGGERRRRRGGYGSRWWHAFFALGGVSALACLLQLTLPPPLGLNMTSEEVAAIGIAPNGCADGLERCICPRATVCATDRLSLALLALARVSVFFDYPLYMMMFLSKARYLNNALRRTLLREWIDFSDMHKLHRLFGIVIGIETTSHSILHLVRWIVNGELRYLSRSATFVTGIIAAITGILIVWPMVVPCIKQSMPYELRKGLHYLSWLWAFVLLFHAPNRIYLLINIPALIYLLDFLVCMFVKNHLIENVHFERYGEKGVAVQFKSPSGVDRSKTSYCYVMCPWISKWQWHAFTMFPDSTKADCMSLCIGCSGDWTNELHKKIKAPCQKPMYVLGPFLSEFSDVAVTTVNAIAIASGIGITPTLSLMSSYAGKKRVNIIWVVEDAGLVEYVLHKVEDIYIVTKNSFFFIYYTGKRSLVLPKDLPINIFIIPNRPKFEEAISGIIAAIDGGEDLPEEMYKQQQAFAETPFAERIRIAIGRIASIYTVDDMFQYALRETNVALSRLKVDEETGDVSGVSREQSDPAEDTEEESVDGFAEDSLGEDLVSVEGLEAMIQTFLGGIGEYSKEDIEEFFHLVDLDGSGYIDEKEFIDLIALATDKESKERPGLTRKPGTNMLGKNMLETSMANCSAQESIHPALVRRKATVHSEIDESLVLGGQESINYMKGMLGNPDLPLDDWSLFYCGASNKIKENLKEISKKYKIKLGIEKFDW